MGGLLPIVADGCIASRVVVRRAPGPKTKTMKGHSDYATCPLVA